MLKIVLRNKNLFAAVAALLLLVCVGCYFYKDVKASLVKQQMADLQAVAYQNNQLMEHEFKNQLDALTSLTATIPDEQHLQSQVENFKHIVDVYRLKRIGVADMAGNCYTTDGFVGNSISRDFFKEAMQGKRYISKHVEDHLGAYTIVNVLSVPIRNNKTQKIIGVLFAVCESNAFRQTFDISSFGGDGYCIVFSEKGDIIVESEQSPFIGQKNLTEGFALINERGEEYAKALLENIKQGRGGMVSINSNGEDKLVHYSPIKLAANDSKLFMFTVVPADALYERLAPVVGSMRGMLLLFLLIGGGMAVYIIYNMYRKSLLISRIAYNDKLTGGANYTGFQKYVEEKKNCQKGYIIAIDIENFSDIEKTADEKITNQIILRVWELIRYGFGKRDYAARVGQAEFVVYTEDASAEMIAKKCEQGSKKILNMSAKLNLPVLHVVCGVYKLKEGDSVEIAYKRACTVKLENKGNYDKYVSFYDDASVALENERKYMTDHFQIALENEEFEVWYQSKIRTDNEEIGGAEALVRWRSDGKLIVPGKFIPLFEGNGMIAALDEYVFTKTCQHLAEWKRLGKKLVPISVNLSRASLYHADVTDRYKKILRKYGIPSEYVQVEITESAVTTDININSHMKKFHEHGVKLLLDDFGSGYSSLASLYKLPFDTVKIDKSLTDIVEKKHGDAMIGQVINFSKRTGKDVVAEGVETKQQVDLLAGMDCDYIQGYYYSKPLPEPEFAAKYL